MKPILTLFLLLNSVSIFCQELFEHQKYRSVSLEIFESDKGIHHFYTNKYRTHHAQLGIDYKDLTTKEISDAARKSKLIYQSPENIRVFLTDLIVGDILSPGFADYQCYNNEEMSNKQISSKLVSDIVPINQSKYLFHNDNNNYFLFDQLTDEISVIDSSSSIPKGALFAKSENEFYSFTYDGIFNITFDTLNNTLKSTQMSTLGNPNAKWTTNSKSIGFIDEGAFYLFDLESESTTKWTEIEDSFSNFYFNKKALYIITYTNEIIKYTKESQPIAVFSNTNTNSNVGIKVQSLFISNDSLIIGAITEKTKALAILKIKEKDELKTLRPQLEISDAECILTYEQDKKILYDCQYSVTNTGKIPVEEFSVYGIPTNPIGGYMYIHFQENTDVLQPNESVTIHFNGHTYFKYYPEQLLIEGANNQRLAELAKTDISRTVTTENMNIESSITIYPNPSNDYFHLNNVEKSSTYILFDVKGTLIQQGNLNDSRIDISHLNNGTYFIHIQNGKTIQILEGVKM